MGDLSSTPDLVTADPMCVAPPADMVGWWPWEGNGNDIQGTNNAALVGSPTFTAGEVGQALSLDGDDYARMPASASLDVGTGNGFSVDMWVNPSVFGAIRPLAVWHNGAGETIQLLLNVANVGDIYANIVDTSFANHILISSGGVVTTNSWQHVTLTYDKTTGLAVIFRDGVIVAQQNLGIFTPWTDKDLWVGYRPAFNDIYKGLLDEVEVFNRALSSVEVQAIVAAGSFGNCTAAEDAMPVQLVSVNAARAGRTVVLTWETVSEIKNAGFRVWREAAGGSLTLIGPALIPARGGELGGAPYRLLDWAAPRQATRYWLEDVSTTGATTRHGPVVAPQANGRLIAPVDPFPPRK